MVSARRLPHAPTADPREIRTLARLALEEARRAGPHLPITSMLLALEGLVRPQAEQACLWPERTRTLRQALERMEMQSPGCHPALRAPGCRLHPPRGDLPPGERIAGAPPLPAPQGAAGPSPPWPSRHSPRRLHSHRMGGIP